MRMRLIHHYLVYVFVRVFRSLMSIFYMAHGFQITRFYYLLIVIPILYIYVSIRLLVADVTNYHQDYFNQEIENDHEETQRLLEAISQKNRLILLWDNSFNNIEEGNKVFIDNKCRYDNCYITKNKDSNKDVRDFHAVVFGPETTKINGMNLPRKRYLYQKYIFFSNEPPQMNPACDNRFNNFFNWSWTYKLNSEIRLGLVVRDFNDTVVGPKYNMEWISTNDSLDENEEKDLNEMIPTKVAAAVWIASTEWSFNGREKKIGQLRSALMDYGLTLDVIGTRGLRCVEKNANFTCDQLIEGHYFFYMAFEKAMSEDYVTTGLLHALNYNTVPIVYGGADYSRFLPPGSYLDATSESPERLAKKIYELTKDRQKYLEYFYWKKHYTYHDASSRSDTIEYCTLCRLLNENTFVRTSTYGDFRAWWNSSECRNDSLSYED